MFFQFVDVFDHIFHFLFIFFFANFDDFFSFFIPFFMSVNFPGSWKFLSFKSGVGFVDFVFLFFRFLFSDVFEHFFHFLFFLQICCFMFKKEQKFRKNEKMKNTKKVVANTGSKFFFKKKI